MKPLRDTLRDTERGSPLLERAKTLLDAAEPLPESRERMLRVRRALDQRRGLWVSLRQLPAAAMAALIVLFGASAFAAVRVFVAVQSAAVEEGAAEAGAAAKRGKRRGNGGKAQPTMAAPAPGAERTAEQPALAPSAAPSAKTASTAKGHAGHRAPSTRTRAERREQDTTPEALARATDSELVHRAAKALRSEHDPAFAARLLEAHRARSPSGPLAEEALSLQIEALSALRSPRAVAHAREYLARYPGGRYSAVAKRALSDAAR